MSYILAYDVGTTGVKVCLFQVDRSIQLLCSSSKGYPLYVMPDGGAEQDGDEWWNAMCLSTRELFTKTSVLPSEVSGISFCSQMQGLILTDENGTPIRRPMSYMDQRAKEEIRKGIAYGLKIAGANIFKVIPSIIITGAISSSVKDPVWKYKWVEAHEPDRFAKAVHWLDVKDYLISRCTGEFKMTRDSAFATLLYDTRKGKEGWSHKMCSMFGIKESLLPPIIESTDEVGPLTVKAASELGLAPGTPVFGGGGDSSLIGVGAGCVRVGDTHLYAGTSGWVVTVTDRQAVDAGSMIAAIVGAQPGRFNYFAEMETAGKCLEWVKDHLALDEINIYLRKKDDKGFEAIYTDLYNYMVNAVKEVPPGSGGVIFTPWLHGNRCPFEDPLATGMFFGINLNTGKTELIHAVLEGIYYHLRWMMECQDKKIKTSEVVRFVGGGALAPHCCQMLSDVLGKTVETVQSPENVGSVGAAAVAAVGLKMIPSLDCVRDFIPASAVYYPDMEKHRQYEPYFETFKKLYRTNRKIYPMIPRKGDKS